MHFLQCSLTCNLLLSLPFYTHSRSFIALALPQSTIKHKPWDLTMNAAYVPEMFQSLETGNITSSRWTQKHAAINNSAASEGWDTQVYAHARARFCNDILTTFEPTGRKQDEPWRLTSPRLFDGQETRHSFLKRVAATRAWECSLLVHLLFSSRCIQSTVNKSFRQGKKVSTSAPQRMISEKF